MPNRVPLPNWVEPQLAQSVESPPAGEDWAHEIKHDGYRVHIRLDGGNVRLLTRSGLNWTDKYPEIAGAAAKIRADTAYIDGELTALRPDGTSSFAQLQAASDRGSGAGLVFIAFDLLHLNGENLMTRPLIKRKKRLAALLKRAPPVIQYGDHVIGNGAKFYDTCSRLGVEGVVSKRLDALYVPGNRGLWRKAKCHQRGEFIIVGYSEPEGSRPYLGALLLGHYDGAGRLIYAGRAGTGMSARELKRLHDKLKPLAVKKMPLAAPPPKTNRFGSPLNLARVTWVRPEFVAEVRFATWTAEGLLRHVSYEGLREGKSAKMRRPTR